MNHTILKYEEECHFIKNLFYLNLFQNQPNFSKIIKYDAKKLKIHVDILRSLLDLKIDLNLETRVKIIDSIVMQILEALMKMHSMGIIHCDLKLDNILCTYKSNKIKCYIYNFDHATLEKNFLKMDGIDRSYKKTHVTKEYDFFCLKNLIFDFLDDYDDKVYSKKLNKYAKQFLNMQYENQNEIKIHTLYEKLTNYYDPETSFYITNCITVYNFCDESPGEIDLSHFDKPNFLKLKINKNINPVFDPLVENPDDDSSISEIIKFKKVKNYDRVRDIVDILVMPYKLTPKNITPIIKKFMDKLNYITELDQKIYVLVRFFKFLKDIDVYTVYSKYEDYLETIRNKYIEFCDEIKFKNSMLDSNDYFLRK